MHDRVIGASLPSTQALAYLGDAAYSLRAATISNYYKKTLCVMTGYPTLTFNYQHGIAAGYQIGSITTIFNSLKKETANAAVAVATKLDGDKVVVSASLKSKEADRYKFNILFFNKIRKIVKIRF